MRVYLAGPINGCTDLQANGWRDIVRNTLAGRVELVDPMARDYRGHEDADARAIVEGDKADIEACDVVLAYCWQPSYGTAMEIHHAWTKGIPVFVAGRRPYSPWLSYHARTFDGIGDAVLEIARLAAASRSPGTRGTP